MELSRKHPHINSPLPLNGMELGSCNVQYLLLGPVSWEVWQQSPSASDTC